jgi:hypothetical protein
MYCQHEIRLKLRPDQAASAFDSALISMNKLIKPPEMKYANALKMSANNADKFAIYAKLKLST